MNSFRNLKNEPIVPNSVDIFILNAGFEPRSISVISRLRKDFAKHNLICQIDKSGVETKPQILDCPLAVNGITSEVDLKTESPIEIADKLIEGISQIPKPTFGRAKIAIDITCFTHEILLILFKVIEFHVPNSELSFFYTQAQSYDPQNDPKKKWLSYGVTEVRSILGYSGLITPSKSTHLILLAGFEVKRALSIISTVEPDAVSIGMGDETSLNSEVQKTNAHAVSEIVKQSRRAQITTFEFPPFDFAATKHVLKKRINSIDQNVVVVPMNTKISTLGAGLLANEHPEVQLMYGLAEAYNVASYSTAQSTSYWFSLNGI